MKNTSYRRFLYDVVVGFVLPAGVTRLIWGCLWVGLAAGTPVKIWHVNGASDFALVMFVVPAVPVSIFLMSILLWLYERARVFFIFPFPKCAQGKCKGIGDYDWMAGCIFGGMLMYGLNLWRWRAYQCKCGDHYVRIGRKFMKSTEFFEVTPYKRLAGFRKWTDDTSN